jgi:hypothetical protein
VTVLSVQDRIDLRDFLVQSFAATEIEDLLFEIGLSTDDLPHATRPELARSVIGHCERTGALGCLLERIVAARPDSRMAALLAQVGPCDAERVKVQVIFPVDQLRVSREEFVRTLAALFDGASPESIELIGAAQGGARALISLPSAPAPGTSPAEAPPVAGPHATPNVRPYDTLEPLDQQTWRYGLERALWLPSKQLIPAAPRLARAARLPLLQIGLLAVALVGLIGAVLLLVAPRSVLPSMGPQLESDLHSFAPPAIITLIGFIIALATGLWLSWRAVIVEVGADGPPAPAQPAWDTVRAAVAQAANR